MWLAIYSLVAGKYLWNGMGIRRKMSRIYLVFDDKHIEYVFLSFEEYTYISLAYYNIALNRISEKQLVDLSCISNIERNIIAYLIEQKTLWRRRKKPAYGRHRISWPMLIEAPITKEIFFWGGRTDAHTDVLREGGWSHMSCESAEI